MQTTVLPHPEPMSLPKRDHFETLEMIEAATLKLLEYCARHKWSGFDPYDGLNSRVFAALPLRKNKLARMMFIQLMKRSPVNCRPMMCVPAEPNAKALALFVSALLKLSDSGLVAARRTIVSLLCRLQTLKSPDYPYFCWGYNFDWQARHFLARKSTPNIICTTFVGNAFLDAYDRYQDNSYLEIAVDAGYFLLHGLKMTQSNQGICFSYTPCDRERVHNANLLGAAFLARLGQVTGEKNFAEYAQAAVRFSVAHQAADGSWPYGEGRSQKWIDNFHTGYNLVALKCFCQYTGSTDWRDHLRRGFDFYRSHFFTPGGPPKYYHDRLYPIDIHAIAQSLITLLAFDHLNGSNLDWALRLCRWSIDNMQSPEGYFYYQKGRLIMNKISYMRWSQAWMLYALAHLKEAIGYESTVAPAEIFG